MIGNDEKVSQTRRFIEVLVHDDRNSSYKVARRRRRPDGAFEWKEHSCCVTSLKYLEFDSESEWFMTRNGFSRGKRRRNEHCRQVNALLYDIDFHEHPQDAGILTELALAVCEHGWNQGTIPKPTMVVSTGCGLHLYYVLEKSSSCRKRGGEWNSVGLEYLHDVERRLSKAVKKVFEVMPEATVDESVFDLTRVSRIPGTVNARTGRFCELAYDSGTYYSLGFLSSFLPKTNVRDMDMGQGSGIARFKRTVNHLAMLRVRKIEELQEFRGYDNIGNRELMCFLYYNSAVQIYDRDLAFSKLIDFNARFLDPISSVELDQIQSSVDKVGYYLMSKGKVIEFLDLTQSEINGTNFFSSKRDCERADAKRRTAERRAERNLLIIKLRYDECLTLNEIAKKASCSRSTVLAVLKAYETNNRKQSLKDIARAILSDVSRSVSDSTYFCQTFLRDVGCRSESAACGIIEASDWRRLASGLQLSSCVKQLE